MTLPGLPYVVVDMTSLRKPDEIDPLIDEYDRSGQRIMMPFHARYELLKGDVSTWTTSMRLLSKRPDVVSVALERGVLLEKEQGDFRVLINVDDADGTSGLRNYLRAMQARVPDETIWSALRHDAHASQRLVREERFADLFRLIKWSHDPGKDTHLMRKDLGRPRWDHTRFRRMLADSVTTDSLRQALEASDAMSAATAMRLVAFPSIAALDMLTTLAISAYRQLLGTNNTEDLEHDGCDAEAIVIALYGRDLRTGDKLTRRLYEDVKGLAASLWPSTIAPA